MPLDTYITEGEPSRQSADVLEMVSFWYMLVASAVQSRMINIGICITYILVVVGSKIYVLLFLMIRVDFYWFDFLEYIGNFSILKLHKPQKMSIKILLLLYFFTFTLYALNCTNSYSFDGSSCTFNLHNPQNTCSQFNFINCTWQECSSWLFNGKTSYCSQYVSKRSKDWDTCTSACCQSSGSYPQTWDSIQVCQDKIDGRNNTKKMILYITLGISGGLASLVVLIVILIRCFRQTSQQQQNPDQTANHMIMLRRWANQRQHLPPIYKHPQIVDHSQAVMSIKWIDVPDLPQKFKQCCSVCLDNKVCLELQCGHCYHRKCIIECISRKMECILCRSVNINHIKVYCQNCVKCYYSTTLMDHLTELSTGMVSCPKCINSTQIK